MSIASLVVGIILLVWAALAFILHMVVPAWAGLAFLSCTKDAWLRIPAAFWNAFIDLTAWYNKKERAWIFWLSILGLVLILL